MADRFDRLAEDLVSGAQERFVADMSARLAEMLVRGVTNPDMLGTLARVARGAALAVWAEHEREVTEETREAFEEAVDEEDKSIVAALSSTGLPVAYDTAYGRAVAAEAARGVAEIVRRQNVAVADSMADAWLRATAEAVTRWESGESRRSVLERAVRELADAGLETIDYASGARVRADAALRRHLVTQANQARNDVLMHRMDEWGHDLVYTTAHFGARPTHAVWQGRVFSRSGSSPDYPPLAESTGYGTAGGLCGASCRHRMVPYVEGYSQLPDTDFSELEARLGMTSGEYYEATQRQRRYEAAIRRTKREIAVGEAAGVDMTDRRVLLGRQQDRVRQWCRDNNLTRDYERERAYGVPGAQPRALRRAPALSSAARRAETAPRKAAARAGALSSDEAKALAGSDMLVRQLGSKATGDLAAAIDDAMSSGGARRRAAQAIARGVQNGTIKIEARKNISRNQFDANRGKVFLRAEYVPPRTVAHECAHALDFLTEVTYGQYGLVSRRNRWASTEYTDGSGYIAALMKDDWANLVAKHDDPVKLIKDRASALGLGRSYPDVGFLDDMLEAASGTATPLGAGGHMAQNRAYWSQLRGQMPSVEALADYAGSAVGNRVEWELMRELFPQAAHAMDGLLEEILNATP